MEKRIAEIVRNTRNKLGLTQRDFAKLIDVKRESIASYETGRSEPPGGIMLRIIELGRLKSAAA